MSVPEYDLKMYLALEARAIYEHQWILGVQKNRPIVELDAAEDFSERFGRKFREYYESHLGTIVEMCKMHCPKGCKGVPNCDINPDNLHDMLKLI
jgi:hypothetical protein